MKQSFAAEKLASVANCVGPMLTHRVAQRRVVSVKSVPLCPSHCVPTMHTDDSGGGSGERRMHNAWHARVSFLLRILSRSCCVGWGERGWVGVRGRARERGWRGPLGAKLVGVCHPVAKYTRARGRGNCKVSYGTFAPRVNSTTRLLPPPTSLFLSLVVCYAEILTATYSSVRAPTLPFPCPSYFSGFSNKNSWAIRTIISDVRLHVKN